MRDDDPMAAALSTQLDSLRRERERLEELLMLDANWRALRQLEAQCAAGEPAQAADGIALKQSLLEALRGNRIYAARAKLLETIELLSADWAPGAAPAEAGSLASRIVLLSEPAGETFRARLRMKPPEERVEAPPPVAPHDKPAALPDALELIDGLGRRSVELLRDGGITRFDDIARWRGVDVQSWRTRLEGTTHGTPGSWIEQAAVLASGRTTSFADRVRRGEFAALVTMPEVRADDARKSDVPLPPAAAETAPRLPPPIPPKLLAEPPVSPPPPLLDNVCRVKAEDLALTLAQLSHKLQPSQVSVVTVAETVDPAAATATSPQGYRRRRQYSGVLERESDVIVVSSLADATPWPAAEPAGASRPTPLLRRLKGLNSPKRFEADAYAAYHSTIEEASVTIVPPSGIRASAVPSPVNGSEHRRDRIANRFLKALTGKD